MKWTCKCCRENIERKLDVYSNPYLLDPLWLHLKEQHKEIYEQMMDFENPYDVSDMYIKKKGQLPTGWNIVKTTADIWHRERT